MKNCSVSKVFVFHHGRKLYIWPFLIQIATFGKWLRLSAKSLLSKTEKTQISEQTQIIWVRWSLWVGLLLKEELKREAKDFEGCISSTSSAQLNSSSPPLLAHHAWKQDWWPKLGKGGNAGTGAVKILALPRLAWPPPPYPNPGTLVDLTTKARKCDSQHFEDKSA